METARDKPFRVVAWPKWSPSNKYAGALADAVQMSGNVEVYSLDMHWKMIARAIVRPVQIQHVHWLERAFWAPSSSRMLFQVLLVWIVTLIMRIRGARLIWTAHDPQPHQSPINAALFSGWSSRLWRIYRRHMLSMVDGVILMSETHRENVSAYFRRPEKVPMAVIPHPHYRGQYPDEISRADARSMHGLAGGVPVIAFIGTLREYKNPVGLLNAFRETSGDSALLMAGSTESDQHTQHYKALAALDPRVQLDCGFVADEDLQHWFRASDLAILPYQRVTNSGSAHLALSFDLPVLVPNEEIFVELERRVGAQWVRRYSGTLDGASIKEALDWIRQPRPQSPDLSQIGWPVIGRSTLQFYREIAQRSE